MASDERTRARTSSFTLAAKIFRAVLPYRWILLGMIVCILLQSACAIGRVTLPKFLVDDVILPAGTASLEPELPATPGNVATAALFRAVGSRVRTQPVFASTGLGSAAINAALQLSGRRPDQREVVAGGTLGELEAGLEGWKETIYGMIRGTGGPMQTLINISLLAVIFALGLSISSYFASYWQRELVLRVNADIRRQLFAHLLKLEISFYSRREGGDLLSRITNDLGAFELALQILFSDLFVQPVTIGFAFVTAVLINPYLTVSTIVIGPPLYLVVRRFGKKIKKRARKRQQVSAKFVQAVSQAIGGVRIIKAFDAGDAELENFDQINEQIVRHSLKVTRTHVLSSNIIQATNNLLVPAFLFGGGMMLLSNRFTLDPGDLVFFLGLLITIYKPARSLSRAWNGFQEALAGADRVYEVLEHRPEIRDAEDAVELPPLRDGIRFEDVRFCYPGSDQEVLRGVSFSMRKGEVVALVGPSGAGKSTILSLLPRFYDVTGGRVSFEGLDLRKVRRSSLLQRMALVTQDPYLFNTTVAENLRYGKRDATRADMDRALSDANFTEVLERLPQGYDTVLGDRGANLSGGERQRLTIARALLRDPDVLLLDEATASLDSQSERQVQEALERLMKGRTTLVIAHRLATIRNADRILVIDDGRVVESGSHDELVARGGLYKLMVDMQFRDGAIESAGTEDGSPAINLSGGGSEDA